MSVARVRSARFTRFVVMAGAVLGLTTIGEATATAEPPAHAAGQAAAQQTAAGRPSFKVTISPAYATAGQVTWFEVTVVNASPKGIALKSLQLTAPTGFKLSQPAGWQSKPTVRGRTLSRPKLSLGPGAKTRFNIRATAPVRCGNSALHWSPRAFQSTANSGPQLALQTGPSSVGVTVLCPSIAVCGNGASTCFTSIKTSVSTYGVVSNTNSGTLRTTINVGTPLRCGTYRFRDPNWYDSVLTSAAPPPAGAASPVEQVSYTIKNTSSNGIGFCLGATYDFTTASGSQAPAGKLPNGTPGFIGLLPQCVNGGPPCISGITQQSDASVKSGHDAVMSILVPELGDPWGSG
jgi:hypothetical protein